MIEKVGGRRDAVRQHSQDRAERKSGGKKFLYKMRLDLGADPMKIHLQKPEKAYADYKDPEQKFWWKRGAKHYVARVKKFLECTNDTCLACAYRDPKAFGFDNVAPERMLDQAGAKEFYCVSGWVEMWYHWGDRTRKHDGKIIEFKSRELCTGRGCDDCANKYPKVFGKRFYYDFSSPAWHDSINSVYERVERICKDGGYLYPVNYTCGECSEQLFDMTQVCPSCSADDQIGIDAESHTASCGSCDTEWTLLECEDTSLKDLAEHPMKCGSCDHQGFPEINMLKITAEGEVVDPAEDEDVYDIYDVQFTLCKLGEKKQARIHVKKWEIKEPDPRLFDAKVQGDEDTAEGMVDRHKKALDLDSVHAPDIPAVQAKVLGLDNLFSTSGGASGTKVVDYSRNSEEEETEEEETEEEETEEAQPPKRKGPRRLGRARA